MCIFKAVFYKLLLTSAEPCTAKLSLMSLSSTNSLIIS